LKLDLYQVDAFTQGVFGGNPAAVVPLESWPADGLLQQIAAENNLSETAFTVPCEGGFELRWFTPLVEVELCGHATLAAAFVLMTVLEPERRDVRYFTRRAGELSVRKLSERSLELNFPARVPARIDALEGLGEALGAEPEALFTTEHFALAVFSTEEEILALEPDFRRLARTEPEAVIVSAPGSDCDFVSRMFAPRVGIDEDPVTGSAHCVLAPFWSERLSRNPLTARQLSKRGGELLCEVKGDRVRISGSAALYMHGTVVLP